MMADFSDFEQMRRMRNRLPSGDWYDIRTQDDGTAVIRIYDEISLFGVTAQDFVEELDGLDAEQIRVEINSPGGNVFDGIAIFNALRTHDADIVTRVDGIAASAASVIVQAGGERIMVESAQMMIHAAWGMAIGDAEVMREFADLLDRQTDVIAGIYANRSGRPVDEFTDLLSDGDTWLTDRETVELGLADDVLDPDTGDGDGDGGTDALLRQLLSDRNRAKAILNVGRTLSAANRRRIEDAIGKLEDVLDDADDSDADDGDGGASGRPLTWRIRAGETLGGLLGELVDAKAEDEDRSRGDVITEMADEAGISESTVRSIIAGDINCPPVERLEAFADVLDVDAGRLIGAAEDDGCDYDPDDTTTSAGERKNGDVTDDDATVTALKQLRDHLTIATKEH